MKVRNLIIAIIVAAIAVGVIFVSKTIVLGRASNKNMPAKQDKGKAKAAVTVSEKKTFQKGMGGLTVKTKNSKNNDIGLRVKAFRSEKSASSVFLSSFTSGRMQELPPGAYDIEIDTAPAKIFKNIKVSEGKETVANLGSVSGALNVKTLNSKKKEAYLVFRLIYPKANLTIASATTNRPLEILPGVYNVELDTMPRQVKKDVNVESGKETIIDLGVVSGALTVKVADNSGTDVRLPVRVRSASANAIIASGISNASMEVMPGTYDIEVMSIPSQMKKDVGVSAGEDTNIEFVVSPPALPKVAAPASSPAKKKR